MKTILLLLVPAVALLVSACAPAGPTYVSGGGGGYYGPSGVWIAGGGGGYDRDHGYDHGDYHDSQQYNRSVTHVNDVNVNRTVENDRTVNRTNVNQVNLSKKTVQANSKSEVRKGDKKGNEQGQNGEAVAQGQYHQ